MWPERFGPMVGRREIKKGHDVSIVTFFVRVPGLEPGAFWFVAKRSIQLGYIRSFCVPKYSFPLEIVKGVLSKKMIFF